MSPSSLFANGPFSLAAVGIELATLDDKLSFAAETEVGLRELRADANELALASKAEDPEVIMELATDDASDALDDNAEDASDAMDAIAEDAELVSKVLRTEVALSLAEEATLDTCSSPSSNMSSRMLALTMATMANIAASRVKIFIDVCVVVIAAAFCDDLSAVWRHLSYLKL